MWDEATATFMMVTAISAIDTSSRSEDITIIRTTGTYQWSGRPYPRSTLSL